jgi:hypothetical protein
MSVHLSFLNFGIGTTPILTELGGTVDAYGSAIWAIDVQQPEGSIRLLYVL